MNILSNLEYLSIEIGEQCNLSKAHDKCPANVRSMDKSHGLLNDDDIIAVIKDAHDSGFRGEVGFHYFNEPLMYLERIKGVIDACPYAKFILWTNGSLINNDIAENEYLNWFSNIVISNYGGPARYRFYLSLQETYPNISRIINYSPTMQMDNRKQIYEYSASNRYGCRRPFDIELPIDCFGNVHLCCRDWNNSVKIGNVKTQALSEIVVSSVFLSLKDSIHQPLLDLEYCPEVCKKCDLPDLVYQNIVYDSEKLPPIKATLSSVVVSRAKDPKRLIDLLASLNKISDEVILIFDGEDPKLIKKFSRHATRVISISGRGSLEAYSMDILKYCTKDWIFRVDDDETLSPSITRKFLQHLISDRYATSYWFPRLWYVSQNEYIISTPHFPDYQLRLFRNIPAIITLPARIHEVISVAGKSKYVNEAHLKHWDFCVSTRKERESKVNYYESLCPQFINKEFYLYEDYEYAVTSGEFENVIISAPNTVAASSVPEIAVVGGLVYVTKVLINVTDHTARSIIENHENVYISYHWFNEDMAVYQWDGNRGYMNSVDNGCEVSTVIQIQIPEMPGTYYLQFDIVEEGVQWFSSSGLLNSDYIEVKVLPANSDLAIMKTRNGTGINDTK